ncbi:MAG: DUF4912 domain-containing protein [Moorellales bacterium]
MLWILLLGGILLLIGFMYYRYRRERHHRRIPVAVHEVSPPRREELPSGYGREEIVALVKDPYWLHAYWEVTAAKQQEFSQMFGPETWEKSQPVIRVYDVTEAPGPHAGAAPYQDVEINDHANNWYLYLGRPEHSFYLELGRRLPDGRFLALARSNVVTLPSNAPSALIDPLWPPLEELQAGRTVAWGHTVGTSPVGWGVSSALVAGWRSR